MVHELNPYLEKPEHQRRTTFHYQQPAIINNGTAADKNKNSSKISHRGQPGRVKTNSPLDLILNIFHRTAVFQTYRHSTAITNNRIQNNLPEKFAIFLTNSSLVFSFLSL